MLTAAVSVNAAVLSASLMFTQHLYVQLSANYCAWELNSILACERNGVKVLWYSHSSETSTQRGPEACAVAPNQLWAELGLNPSPIALGLERTTVRDRRKQPDRQEAVRHRQEETRDRKW